MLSDGKPRVLVAEDDPPVLDLLTRLLQREGYTVVGCPNGRAAAQAISELGGGLVLADWYMPEMDGLQFCHWIKEMQSLETIRNVYVIMVTAKEGKNDLIAALAAGASDYLTKPYHEGELLARVRVGQRVLQLQDELLRRSLEIQKANSAMALLAARLDTAAHTDVLTGLVNRRRIVKRLEEYLETPGPNGAITCLMIDVDRFKQVNDTYGHAAGDRVLVEVAAAIGRTARRPELCGRFGGEEFLVLLPRMAEAAAIQVAEQMRQAVAGAVVHTREGVQVSVTISIGIALRRSDDTAADELLRAADGMLYQAKQHGRNQTWVLGADGWSYAAHDPQLREPLDPSTPSTASVRKRARDKAVECRHAHSADER